MRYNVIPLHKKNALIPAIPFGRPYCAFCHQPKPAGQLVKNPDKPEVTICFTCIETAVSLAK